MNIPSSDQGRSIYGLSASFLPWVGDDKGEGDFLGNPFYLIA
jgi:hypothetical protein